MTFEDHGIYVKGSGGQEKVICPKCSHQRRKGSGPCLSVSIDEGVWNCHHCGWKGTLHKKADTPYIKPIEKPKEKIITTLPEKVLEWFESRGISETTLESEKIGFKDRWIQFPFYKDNEVVNIKSRTADKKFMQTKNAEKCFYRFDSMIGMETIIITEGEMDTLSLVESGFMNAVSVPDGAIAPNSKGSDKKFSYLLSAEEHLMKAETVILCTDNDPSGDALMNELSRRIGREKCYKVTYPQGCKDINEVLINHGKEKVMEVISSAYPYPIEGVVTIADVTEDAIELLNAPAHQGLSTGWVAIDSLYRISPSEVTVVTGVPNMGKSEWMDALMINMIQDYGWKFGIFSAENFPIKHHLLKLVGKFAAQPFFGEDKMSEQTARDSMTILDDHIKFIGTQEDSVSIKTIMSTAKLLNYRYGLNGLIIDPWNTLEHKFGSGENETLYVSRVLAELNAFAKMNEMHIWVVTHPRKMENDNNRKPLVPTPYDISGSANWFNKCDNAITVHRHRSEDEDYVGIHVHKIRFQYKNGKPGVGKLNYNIKTGKYIEYEEQFKEALFE